MIFNNIFNWPLYEKIEKIKDIKILMKFCVRYP